MAARTIRNGSLAQAMTLLIQNQAAYVGDMRERHRDIADIRKEMADIRRDLEQIKAILIRHERILANLPEAIREKIGFKATSDQT
jgi:tRNA A37 methylthiotransferase MiaB